MGHFAPVRIPSQSLSLDFDNSKSFQPHHYAFKVGEAEFDDIFGRVKAEGLAYGSGPFTPDDMKINTGMVAAAFTFAILMGICWNCSQRLQRRKLCPNSDLPSHSHRDA